MLASLLGAGDGRFGVARTVVSGESVNGVAVGDLDGDARLDLVVGSSSGEGDPPLRVLLGRGDGTFAPPVGEREPHSLGKVAVGDMNGDGALDVVAAMTGVEQSIAVFLNDGAGGLAAPLKRALPSISQSEVVLFDVNRDGNLDVVANQRLESSVAVLLGAGNGELGEPTLHATGRSPVSLAVGDVDRDGFADLVTANGDDETITVIHLGRAGSTLGRKEIPLAERPAAVALGDMDQRPGLDIVIASETGGRITILGLHGPRGAWGKERMFRGWPGGEVCR